jgi:hypothetical protein
MRTATVLDCVSDALPIHQLIYVSASKALMSPAELGGLLLDARAKNKRHGLTGMLVHHEGSFLQVLEGEEAAVERVFAKISRDPRHHRIVILSRAGVPSSAFDDWSMGFVDGGNPSLSNLPGFNDFFRRGFEAARLAETKGRAKELFFAFRDGRFRQFVNV